MAITGTRTAGNEQSMDDCYVAVDLTPATSSYADISTWGASVSVSGGEPANDTFHTFSGSPIGSVGKAGPRRVDVTCVYTNISTDPFVQIYAATAGSLMDVKWSKSNTAGERELKTVNGKFLHCTIPAKDSNQGGVETFTFSIIANSISSTEL